MTNEKEIISTLEEALEKLSDRIRNPRFAAEMRELFAKNEKVECEITLLRKHGSLVLNMTTRAISVKRSNGTFLRLE